MKYLRNLILLLAVVLTACGGDSTGPSHDNSVIFTVNGDTTLVPVDTSAGAEYVMVFQAQEDIGSTATLEVRFSVNAGSLSKTVDTTDVNHEVTTTWTFGTTAGPQEFLAEFYRMDGTRITGYGKVLPVHAAATAHIPWTFDSIVQFVDEKFAVLSHFSGNITDQYGNVRSIGTYGMHTTSGSWNINADTIGSVTPQSSQLVFNAGQANDTFAIRSVERYLLNHPFTFTYGCDVPATLRASDSLTLTAQYSSSGSVTDVLHPGDAGFVGAYGGILQLKLSQTIVRTWEDAQVDTLINTSERIAVTSWRPDSVGYFNNSTGLRVGTVVTGGNWCTKLFANASNVIPAVLTQQ